MNHPEDLLADYVDGSLGAAARASVDAHLVDCSRCRDEVGQAGAARVALRRLPQVDAPSGVASEALREAVGSRAERPPRYARLLPIAAAAVLVGLLAVALPRLGHGDDSRVTAVGAHPETADGAAIESGSTRDLATYAKVGAPVDNVQGEFGDEAIRALVDDAASRWSGVAFPNNVSSEGEVPRAITGSALANDAAVCVFTDVPAKQPSILVRLIEATYQGEPAFVAVVLEGTEAGKPADRAVVWVVRKDDCSLARVAESPI